MLKWSLAPLALAALAMGSAKADEGNVDSPVPYVAYTSDNTAAPAAPAAPADSGCTTENCGCDSGCCCCPPIEWEWCLNPATSCVHVGAGLRTSFNDFYGQNGTTIFAGRSHYTDFAQNDDRIYLSGQGNDYLKFTLNTETSLADTSPFELPPGTREYVRILDAIVQFEFNDQVNVWMGRLIAPSDRSNLDGPFYMTPFDFPFVSNFPAAFDGRDDGAVFWGSLGCGAFKYSAGVFNGQGRGAGDFGTGFASGSAVSNPSGDLMFAARAQLDLLDPEPGYYAQDSYFGDKDILAVGASVNTQKDAVGTTAAPKNFTVYEIDTMFETKLPNCGVVSFLGEYYNYDDQNAPSAFVEALQGTAYLVQASYLTGREFCFGKLSGHFQPYVRYQYYNYDDKASAAGFNQEKSEWDVGTNYVISAYNARLTTQFADDVGQNGSKIDVFTVGAQLQF